MWTEGQLTALNRESLKQRCLGLRDHIGADRLPPMPRHPEGMVTWILKTQELLTQPGGSPVTAASYESYESAPPQSGGGQQPQGVSGGRPPVLSEDQQAYVEGKMAANAARRRNQGGGMADVFGGQ